jgi:lipopolysaccharide export system protein LptC
MNKLYLSSSIVFLIAVLIYGAVSWQTAKTPEATIINNDLTPDFVAEKLASNIYNKNGQLSHVINALRMEHFSKLGMTQFTQPKYTLYPENQQTTWQVSANEGTLDHNNRVTLRNRVRLLSSDKNSLVQEIHCKSLQIDLNTKIISSDQTIMIQGKDFTMYGSGLIVDLNSTQMTLTEHVQTIYKKNPN